MNKKSKDQGHLIVRTEIGRSAPKVETTWMEYTAGSRCRDKVGHDALPAQASGGGNKGEERGFARRGRRAGGHVPKRRKKGGGSSTGMRARIKSGPEAGKRRSAQRTRTVTAARCHEHARIGC